MSRIRVSVFPRSRPMVVEMGGSDSTIPVVTLSEEQYDDAQVSIQLGNTDEPAKWLRESAAALLSLAEQVEVHESIKRGLAQSAAGAVVDLGNFAQYAPAEVSA